MGSSSAIYLLRSLSMIQVGARNVTEHQSGISRRVFQMISDYDHFERRCPALGHQIAFHYCRSVSSGSPCRKALDCWFDRFPIEKFLENHYSTEEIQRITAVPKPKLYSLVELIKQAKESMRKH